MQLQEFLNNPEMQKAFKDAGLDIKELYKNAGMRIAPREASLPQMASNVKWGKLPGKKIALLASLPKQVLNKEALRNYIVGLQQQVNKKIGQADLQYAGQFLKSTGGNAMALSRAAVLAWYKTRPQLALALSLDAAAADHEETEILNTASAILNLCGFENKALPLLMYLDQQLPGNSTVLNNIGQSYLGLGDLQNAEKYLLLCIAKAPLHTEANKSLGMIYNASGQTAKARQCFSNSLKGGFTETAYAGAQKSGLKDFSPVFEFISDRYDKPENFNSYQYNIPQLSENVNDAPRLRLEHLKFRSFLSKQQHLYSTLQVQGSQQFKQSADEFYSKASSGVLPVASPMSSLAARMVLYFEKRYIDASKTSQLQRQDYYADRDKLKKEYEESLRKVNEAFKQKWDALGQKEEIEEREIIALEQEQCKAKDAVTNQYLSSLANLQRRLASQALGVLKEPLQKLIYWQQFVARSYYEANVYSHIAGYLEAVSLVEEEAVFPFSECYEGLQGDPEESKADSALQKPDCPFNISVKFFVGEISMDCEKFGIDLDAGVSITAEKSFVSKETTLAIGVGLELSTGLGMEEIPFVGIKGSVGASEQFYIVFDRNNSPSDIGIKFETGVGVSVNDNVGPLSSKVGNTEAKVGYTLGLNSGWNFEGQALGTKFNLN